MRNEFIKHAAQAVQKASNYAHVTPLRHRHLTEELEKFGLCSYSYGFDYITIEDTSVIDSREE